MMTGEKHRDCTLAEAERCTGCAACEAVCPKGAIRMREDAEGFLRPQVEREACVRCGRCETVCPSLHPQGKKRGEVFAAIHRTEEERMRASSGGVFFALAEAVFRTGKGAVCGAVYTESFDVTHRIAESIGEVRPMQGSKYIAGRQEDCIRRTAELLKAGRTVLWTGTPCQIAGVSAAIRTLCTEEERSRLILVDILCHGLPSPKIWAAYRKRREAAKGSRIVSVNFRNKERGWSRQALELNYADGSRYLAGNEDDPYYVLYFANVMLRPSCYSCPYADRERISDLTIGDYWGNEDAKQPAPDREKGVSLVLVNTGKGKAFLKNCESLELFPGDEKSAYQPLFDAPSARPASRETFWQCVREEGESAAIRRFGRLSAKQKLIKKVIAPLTKRLGIYKLAQKVYFTGGKRKDSSAGKKKET